MKKRIFNLFLYLSLLIITFAIGGCSKSHLKVNQKEKTNQTVIRCPLPAEVGTLDPAKVCDIHTWEVSKQVFEGLVHYDENNHLKPHLAHKIEQSKDGKQIIFYLRKDIKFHNGKKLTAEDVMWSFNRSCDPKMSAPFCELVFGKVKGLDAVVSGKTKVITGFSVIDAHTFKIELLEPYTAFIDKLTYPCAYILPKGKVPQNQEITDLKHAIGTGPFTIKEYYPKQIIVLNTNKAYREPVSINTVEMHIIPDPMMGINKYKAKDIDFCVVPSLESRKIQRDPIYKNQFKEVQTSAIFYLEINPSFYTPFKNKLLRQAIAKAINKNIIVNQILENTVDLANSMVSKGILAHRDETAAHQYNPKLARKLFAQNRHSPKNPLPLLEIVVPFKDKQAVLGAENVSLQLKKNLGIQVKVSVLDWVNYQSKVVNKKFGLRFACWTSVYFDPSSYLSELFTTNSTKNRSGYSNPAYDILCCKADATCDKIARTKMYNKAEDILLQDAYTIPMFFSKGNYLISKKVRNLKFNMSGLMPLNQAKISDL